jgi:hypothetical protein
LQDCVTEDPVFHRDAEKRRKLAGKFKQSSPACCTPKVRLSQAPSSRP